MLQQVWTSVNDEFPSDGWIGQIRIRLQGGGIEELQCLGFSKKSPATGEENSFMYQHGTLDGRTGIITPRSTVTHWLKLVDRG